MQLTRLHHNPFGGLTDEQLPAIVQPRPFTEEVRSLLVKGGRVAIEFLGRHGRGKTTHLRLLAAEFPQASVHLLGKESTPEMLTEDPGRLLFVDGIHRLSYGERRDLLQRDATILYTTHIPRPFLCWSAEMPRQSYRFRGLSAPELTAIIRARTQGAMVDPREQWRVDPAEVSNLLRKFGDDYRGILNHLYQTTDAPA